MPPADDALRLDRADRGLDPDELKSCCAAVYEHPALRWLLGVRSAPVWTHAHRWRYASPPEARDAAYHLGDDGVGLAGDGWGSPRIETAWRSGTALGRAVVEQSRRRSGGT